MKINLIENVFYQEGNLSQKDAIEKAILFYEYVKLSDWDGDDRFYSLSDNYVVNIFLEDDEYDFDSDHDCNYRAKGTLSLYRVNEETGEFDYCNYITIFKNGKMNKGIR